MKRGSGINDQDTEEKIEAGKRLLKKLNESGMIKEAKKKGLWFENTRTGNIFSPRQLVKDCETGFEESNITNYKLFSPMEAIKSLNHAIKNIESEKRKIRQEIKECKEEEIKPFVIRWNDGAGTWLYFVHEYRSGDKEDAALYETTAEAKKECDRLISEYGWVGNFEIIPMNKH
jgi:hypothetical protein